MATESYYVIHHRIPYGFESSLQSLTRFHKSLLDAKAKQNPLERLTHEHCPLVFFERGDTMPFKRLFDAVDLTSAVPVNMDCRRRLKHVELACQIARLMRSLPQEDQAHFLTARSSSIDVFINQVREHLFLFREPWLSSFKTVKEPVFSPSEFAQISASPPPETVVLSEETVRRLAEIEPRMELLAQLRFLPELGCLQKPEPTEATQTDPFELIAHYAV